MKQSQQCFQNEKMEKLIVAVPESKHETVDFMLYVTTFCPTWFSFVLK